MNNNRKNEGLQCGDPGFEFPEYQQDEKSDTKFFDDELPEDSDSIFSDKILLFEERKRKEKNKPEEKK